MAEKKRKRQPAAEFMTHSVEQQAQRKIKARSEKSRSLWFGLGMFGVIGWSVAVPTLAGIALGIWMDKQWPGRASWTLTMMFLGLVLGCFNAWRWIDKADKNDR